MIDGGKVGADEKFKAYAIRSQLEIHNMLCTADLCCPVNLADVRCCSDKLRYLSIA